MKSYYFLLAFVTSIATAYPSLLDDRAKVATFECGAQICRDTQVCCCSDFCRSPTAGCPRICPWNRKKTANRKQARDAWIQESGCALAKERGYLQGFLWTEQARLLGNWLKD